MIAPDHINLELCEGRDEFGNTQRIERERSDEKTAKTKTKILCV